MFEILHKDLYLHSFALFVYSLVFMCATDFSFPLLFLWLILEQVSKRLERTSRYFKRLGSLGFWGQLVCTVVSAVILSFSAVVTWKITSPVTFYTTIGSIVAAFVSVFWSFGYIRLSERLRKTANDPAKVLSLCAIQFFKIIS